MMTPVLLLLLALLPGNAAQIDYPRTMYVGYARAPLYESADYLSSIVGELRRGDSVRVLGADGKFFQIEHGGASAYVLGSNLTLVAVRRKPGKVDAPASLPARRATPAKKHDSTARVATATQCSATTRAGSRCSRMVEDGTGICWQHRRK